MCASRTVRDGRAGRDRLTPGGQALDRRNGQDHSITRRHGYLLTHRGSPAPNGVGDKTKGCEATDQAGRYGKVGLAVPGCGSQTHALRATHRKYVHVQETLVVHLDHGRPVLIGVARTM